MTEKISGFEPASNALHSPIEKRSNFMKKIRKEIKQILRFFLDSLLGSNLSITSRNQKLEKESEAEA